MLGAIIGDIAGSKYEFNNYRSKNFDLLANDCYFTDDTVMTIAVYVALKNCKGKYDKLEDETVKQMHKIGKRYMDSGFGGMFKRWLLTNNTKPYNSFGNGSAMRVSPVVKFAKSLDDVKMLSAKVTKVTHNHPEGIKGAEATAVAIYLAKEGKSKEEIKKYIEENYYDLNFNYEDLVENYRFNETCQESVPQALYCFFISESFEDCLKTTISIGGDSDTLCAISGAIAEAYYGIPDYIKQWGLKFLDKYLLKHIKDVVTE